MPGTAALSFLRPSQVQGFTFLVPLPFVRCSFSSHTKHSRFSRVRLTPTTELLCGHWQTDNLVGSAGATAEGGEWRKSKKRDLEFEKNNPASEGSDETYTRQRVITKTLSLSSKRTNLEQPGNHGHGSTQQSFLALCLHPYTLSASTLKPKWKTRFYLKTTVLGIITDMIRQREAGRQRQKYLSSCTASTGSDSQVLPSFSF